MAKQLAWGVIACLATLCCAFVTADDSLPEWVDTSGLVPADAVVIFDGQETNLLVSPDGGPCNWPIEEGAVVCGVGRQARQQGLWTKLHFRDAQIHVEFLVPNDDKRGEGAGNSGLYIHGLFEQQILDSFENESRPIAMVREASPCLLKRLYWVLSG